LVCGRTDAWIAIGASMRGGIQRARWRRKGFPSPRQCEFSALPKGAAAPKGAAIERIIPPGGAGMVEDSANFADLMADAHHWIAALDEFAMRDGGKAAALAAVKNGKRMYRRLLEHQVTVRMSADESSQLQNAADQIRARLRFFGEPV
jgi:hypothetical protein